MPIRSIVPSRPAKNLGIALVCVLVHLMPLRPQEAAEQVRPIFWFQVGGDPGISMPAFSGEAGAYVCPVSACVVGIRITGTAHPGDDLPKDLSTKDLMVGYQAQTGMGALTVSAGVSAIASTRWEVTGVFLSPGYTATKVEETGVGVPLELALSLRPFRFLGIGIRAFKVFNRFQTYEGVHGVVQFGIVR